MRVQPYMTHRRAAPNRRSFSSTPGTVCSWTISTGQPVVQLTINYTGLAEGDYLTVSTDTGFQARLPSLVDQGGYFSYKMTATK